MNLNKIVKSSFVVVAFSLLFTACAEKNVSDIKPYESFYTNQSAKKKIVFNTIKDDRLLPIVSYIIYNDKVLRKYQINEDLKTWYTNAYMREFNASQITLDQQQQDPKSTIVQITIKELEVKYNKNMLSGQNLTGKVSLEILLQKGNKIVKKLVNTSQSDFKFTISDASGFEEFIYRLLSNSTTQSVNIIIKALEEL